MFRITDDRNIRLTLSGTKVHQKKLPSCADRPNFRSLKKNYQLFQITDNRHIKLTLSSTEVYYRLNFHRGTTRDLAGISWDACFLTLSCVRLVLLICNCMYNYCVSSLAQLETIFLKYSQIRNKVCSRVLLTIA